MAPLAVIGATHFLHILRFDQMSETSLGDDKQSDSSQWNVLIESARNGGEEALGQIVKEFREYLLVVADREIGTQLQAKFDASDVVQTSLVEAMSSINKFKGSSEKEIRSWLTRIVLNNLQDEARRYTKTRARAVDRENATSGILELLRDDLKKTPSAVMSLQEQQRRIELLIQRLPEQQQIVLEHRHEDELSYKEIAERMNISEAAARKIWSRATTQLRQWLQEESLE